MNKIFNEYTTEAFKELITEIYIFMSKMMDTVLLKKLHKKKDILGSE